MKLEVGDHITVKPVSVTSKRRQELYWVRDNLCVGADTIIKPPFLFVGAHMTIEALQRSEAVCRVYDTALITAEMRNRRCVLLPRKYLVRLNPLPRPNVPSK